MNVVACRSLRQIKKQYDGTIQIGVPIRGFLDSSKYVNRRMDGQLRNKDNICRQNGIR